jgi:DNA-directed RNA polymerase sigma subunit (sigma70/sigma32)
MENLTEIKKEIIIYLRMKKYTFATIGKILKLSRQRVFEIYNKKYLTRKSSMIKCNYKRNT